MSPRIILTEKRCMYAECEQHYSNRGFLTRTVICRHPEREGCVCVLEDGGAIACKLCVEREEDKEEEKR